MYKKLAKLLSLTILTSFTLFPSLSASEKQLFGTVNFSSCIAQSKVGQQEQSSFESLKTQLSSLMEDTDKQIQEVASKFKDSDYMDGLSPEAEEELKGKYHALSEEAARYQSQFYQVLNQANMRIVQTVASAVQEAASSVAQKNKLQLIFNKEALFFSAASYDVTDLVVDEMNRVFDAKAGEQKAGKNLPISNEAKGEEAKSSATDKLSLGKK